MSDLECVLPDFAYRATDASGIEENEVCPVFAARGTCIHPPRCSRIPTRFWTGSG